MTDYQLTKASALDLADYLETVPVYVYREFLASIVVLDENEKLKWP
jgi:hypothetical protein